MRIAQADKEKMRILGDDWGRQQAADILGNLANNPGAGGVAAAGAGMGMGIGAGGAFGSMAQQMFAPMNNGFQIKVKKQCRQEYREDLFSRIMVKRNLLQMILNKFFLN